MNVLAGITGNETISPSHSNSSASSNVEVVNNDSFDLRKPSLTASAPSVHLVAPHHLVGHPPSSFFMVGNFPHSPPAPFLLSNANSPPSLLLPTMVRPLTTTAPTFVDANIPVGISVNNSSSNFPAVSFLQHPSSIYLSLPQHQFHQPQQHINATVPTLAAQCVNLK